MWFIIAVILLVLAFLGAYFLVDELLVRRKRTEEAPGTSLVRTGVVFIVRGFSVGALMGLIGYVLGLGLSEYLNHNWTFAGIVSLSTGFAIWAGLCGLVIGFGLALRQWLQAAKQNRDYNSPKESRSD